MNSRAVQQYNQVGTTASVAAANPHGLVAMLMDGFLARLAKVKGHMQRNEIENRTKEINKAVEIIGGLQCGLNFKESEELCTNLDELYNYMASQLFYANRSNDEKAVDEVAMLMRELKMGWDGIADQARQMYQDGK